MTSIEKYDYVVVKTKEFSLFNGFTELPTIIVKAASKGWASHSPLCDDLVRNAEVKIDNGVISITGNRVLYKPPIGSKNRYGKKFELFHEINEKGERVSLEDVKYNVKIHSHNKLNIQDSDIKLFYDGFWDFIRGKKMYYLDNTPEVLSALLHLEKECFKKDRRGFYTEGYCRTTFTQPYKYSTNNYRLENI